MITTKDTKGTKEGEDCKMQIAKCKLQIRTSAIEQLQLDFGQLRRAAICNLQSILCVLCVLCGCFPFAAVRLTAAELVRLEGELVEAKLQAVDREAIAFVGESAFTLSSDQLVRWGHPSEPRPQIIVVLTDGGRMVAAPAWAGGAPLRLAGEEVVVLTDTWDEVRLPRELIHGFVFAQRQHVRKRERLEAIVRSESSPDASGQGTGIDELSTSASLKGSGSVAADSVILTNGDRVTGRLAELAGGSLTLETEVEPVKLPLSRVEAVLLSRKKTRGTPQGRRQAPSFAVGTADGSLVYAEGITANEKELVIEAACGARLNGGSVKDIVILQSLGGRFVYLSDLEPEGYRHVPYLSIEWPFERDRNVLGEPLLVGGKQYLKGIGMHSAARLTYRLDGQYRRFDSTIAIDDSAGGSGSVTFGVYVLRDGGWQEAFTSGVVRGGDPPRPVSVEVMGVDALTLTVDYADRGDEMDRANWLDARLVKKEM